MSGLRTIFGIAVTTANVRASVLGYNDVRQNLCAAFGMAFNIGDTTSIFNVFKNNLNLNLNTLGLDANSQYAAYETAVYDILNAAFPAENEKNKRVLALAVHGVIFGYSQASNLAPANIIELIGQVQISVAATVNNNQIYIVKKDLTGVARLLNNPFNETNLHQLVSRDYASIISTINNSPKDTETKVVNYNWYDMTNVFSRPDFQKMKDIENQYYYVSGQLIYESAAGDLPECIQDETFIVTSAGQIKTTYIRNTPCIDSSSYVGPVTGVNFFRIFNDGPSTSGVFTPEVKAAYTGFDKSVLDKSDYDSNYVSLSVFDTGADGQVVPLTTGVFVDANGQYSLGTEYFYAPTSKCTVHRMHVGDNFPRVLCAKDTDCLTCGSQEVTGFKFASIELNKDWANHFLYIETNPVMSTGRALKRALNLDSNPYVATDVGDELQTYTTDEFGNQFWRVGPPQLNGANSLPNLAFYQTFDNTTFNEYAKIVIFPSIGSADTVRGGDSSRSYSISTKPLLSGQDLTHYPFDSATQAIAKFFRVVASQDSGNDDIYKKFFGMGDNFQNQYQVNSSPQENAGYFYTGFTMSGVDGAINSIDLLAGITGNILGSRVKTVKYISGYQNGSKQIGFNRLISQDGTGKLYQYFYFDPRNVVEPIQSTNWTGNFAPTPDYFEANYPRIYANQNVENYFPRYYSGPYSVETRKFLYPNAAIGNKIYVGKLNGIPLRVKFKVELREEAVKEIFGQYQITRDGTVVTDPTLERVVRPTSSGINPRLITPIMHSLFYPDEAQYDYEYDFNNWKIGGDFDYSAGLDGVDNNYAPTWNGFSPSGRNSEIYSNSSSFGQLFTQGIRMTGLGAIEHRLITTTGGAIRKEYTERPISVGLYHIFKTMSRDMELRYVLPLFDLEVGTKVINQELQDTFPVVFQNQGVTVETNDDRRFTLTTGTDPMFFENVGGRRGVGAENDGGYHSKNIIGDRWLAFDYGNYGMAYLHDIFCHRFDGHRSPQDDNRVLLFNSTPTGTELWTRGLSFAPFKFNRNIKQFKKTDTFKYSIDGSHGTLTTTLSGNVVNFNLSNLMPLKPTTGQEWYTTGGLNIGPFDRDVEVVVLSGKHVLGYTDIYVNHNKISDLYSPDGCSYDALKGPAIGSGIFLNEYNRNADVTVVSVVPSGGMLNVNVFSNPTFGGNANFPSGFKAENFIGIETGSFLSFRARKPLDGSNYDNNLHSGEFGWLTPFNYEDNGLEKLFKLEHSQGFAGLGGTHEFLVFTQTGKLYPVPGADFTGLGTVDRFGNIIYGPDATVEEYWKDYARKNRQNVFLTGWREGSRLSFRITNVSLDFDEIPYQSYRVVVPSGQCTVSGQMGYLAQADRTVFSEGFHLVNNTENDLLERLYNPSYVSDVISRVPWFVTPSGTTTAPVLPAPSVMKQRETLALDSESGYFYLLNNPPENYNKLLWPALSDLETLNPGETIESIAPDNGDTYLNSSMLFSAAQGQQLPNGKKNPTILKTYDIAEQFQLYDSIATDALLNTGVCITSRRGSIVRLSQSNLSGVMTAEGTPLKIAVLGVVT